MEALRAKHAAEVAELEQRLQSAEGRAPHAELQRTLGRAEKFTLGCADI
jgi:hypothetical protein